ncbi:retrovirus-related Pol polyprotein from transposon opus [Trichonephila clavipes]|nr:retrovirus-related Pol polyprotein from transposon opus [Trichonephila clavipes]
MEPKKTLERSKYSFFWEGLRADVKKFCESRKECQLIRSVRVKDRSPITPVARPELPFQVVNLDLIGPIDPPSSKGHKYILCLVDQHTRPEYRDEEICELKTIIIDFPTRTANELRTEQLKDLELKKIIDCFENPNKGVDFANWTGERVRDESGVLYRYSPHAEVEEAQLVVPTHEREREDIKIAP